MDIVIIDESFIDFVSENRIPTVAAEVSGYDHAVVIKSLGKNFGLHGVRCGYAVASAATAAKLTAMLPPWNVNALAEEFIRLFAAYRGEYERGRRQVVRDSAALAAKLGQVSGLTTFPTHANFVYCRVDASVPGSSLRDMLLREHGCFVRECGSKLGSNSQYFRFATRPEPQQQLLIAALEASLNRLAAGGRRCQPVALRPHGESA